jgi:hypothetical protein
VSARGPPDNWYARFRAKRDTSQSARRLAGKQSYSARSVGEKH